MQQQNGQQKNGLSWNDPNANKGSNNNSSGSNNSSQNNSNNNSHKPQSTPTSTVSNDAAAMSTTTTKVVAIFIGLVILLALIIWAVVAMRAANNGSTSATGSSTVVMTGGETSTTTTASGTGTAGGVTLPATGTEPSATSGDLVVGNQPAGNSVKVSGLTVSTPTWVVVYDENNGKPGNVIGAAMVFSGQSSVSVSLLRKTVSGHTYMVGLSSTNNGSHTYSKSTTKPLNVWSSFTAQ
ncbi:MAG: hypothetical protein JWO43_275 [Candidatus Adlerbacteria bacterium]|nr:hypothetical protein [Candidatus Adlerbacteria bacterium]